MPPRQHWRKGEWDNTPLWSVKAAKHELCTQSAVVSFTHRFHWHGNQRRPEKSLELASWFGHTLLQSEHVVPMGAHAGNKDHLCLHTTVAKTKSYEQVSSTLSQKQPLQITNQAVLGGRMPGFGRREASVIQYKRLDYVYCLFSKGACKTHEAY